MVHLRLLIAALWAGSLWTIGYVVAPTLFLMLGDRVLAGTIVGYLLKAEALVAMVCFCALYCVTRWSAVDASHKRSLTLIMSAAFLCAMVIFLGLQPAMAQLKEAAGAAGLAGTPQGKTFGLLHGVSQLFYLTESVLAGWLLLKLR